MLTMRRNPADLRVCYPGLRANGTGEVQEAARIGPMSVQQGLEKMESAMKGPTKVR